MAKAKKPKPKKKKKKSGCQKCGASTGGKSTLCFTCVSEEVTLFDKASAQKVAETIKMKIEKGDTGGPVCPYCKTPLDWTNVGVMEYEVTIYVREKIYYCPACRAFLGVSSWHAEG